MKLQFPSKYQMVINLKPAKAIGPAVPSSLLLRADQLIEYPLGHDRSLAVEVTPVAA
jgi:hypothetical protein